MATEALKRDVAHVVEFVHPLPWKVSQRPAGSPQIRAFPWQLLDGKGNTIGLFANGTAATLPAKAAALADQMSA